MSKTINFKDFKESKYNKKGRTNYKIIGGTCSVCAEPIEYHSVKKFLRSRSKHLDLMEQWDTCATCWKRIVQYDNPEWRKSNSEAQLIAQNKPEQKRKNAEGVSKSWTPERRNEASILMKDRWENGSKEEIGRMLNNLSWTSSKGDKFNEIMKKSFGTGGLKGEYGGVEYDSALELSFLLWCEEENKSVKRYDLEPIVYRDEADRKRNYYPDFILENSIIVEIKGQGLYYRKNYERNIKKNEALKKFCLDSEYEMRYITGDDKILKQKYKKARKIHHENKKQKNI